LENLMIALTVKYDHLCLPPDRMLVHVYAAGDCDTCAWPMVEDVYSVAKQRGILASALFDACETGDIPTSEGRTVTLPNGELFDIDMELLKWEESKAA
jgi:hypothetical protein